MAPGTSHLDECVCLEPKRSNPYYRAAAADIAAEVDGILYLDTYGALPNYADGVAAGYYGDQVHYNATGDRALFRAIDELIVTAAQY